nr:MAG TPA: hypothetical protein [Caudoviricetes sp.]
MLIVLLFPNLNSLNSCYRLVERVIERLTPLGIPLYTLTHNSRIQRS